jgi:hypothetical protein
MLDMRVVPGSFHDGELALGSAFDFSQDAVWKCPPIKTMPPLPNWDSEPMTFRTALIFFE